MSLDRTGFVATPAGGLVQLWTGERVRATGSLPNHDATVSLHGTFVEPDVLRVDRIAVHRGHRDWPSYLGLVLLALVFLRGGLRSRAPSDASAGHNPGPCASRVAVLLAALVVVCGPAVAATKRAPQRAPFSVVEASIPEMQAAMEEGRVTSRELVLQYLTRIALYEDRLNAVITVNPRRAATRPRRCDRERAAGRLRGPLHGIPIALKDNIHTTDMPTTGGALAFDGLVPPYEATLTAEPARGGRDHHRQDRDDRARQLGGERHARATTTRSPATA